MRGWPSQRVIIANEFYVHRTNNRIFTIPAIKWLPSLTQRWAMVCHWIHCKLGLFSRTNSTLNFLNLKTRRLDLNGSRISSNWPRRCPCRTESPAMRDMWRWTNAGLMLGHRRSLNHHLLDVVECPCWHLDPPWCVRTDTGISGWFTIWRIGYFLILGLAGGIPLIQGWSRRLHATIYTQQTLHL